MAQFTFNTEPIDDNERVWGSSMVAAVRWDRSSW